MIVIVMLIISIHPSFNNAKINEKTVSQRQQVANRQVNKTPFAKMSEHMLFSVINITRLIMVNNLTYFVSYIRFQTCIRIKPIYYYNIKIKR